jgi:hypothetical protein
MTMVRMILKKLIASKCWLLKIGASFESTGAGAVDPGTSPVAVEVILPGE